MALFRGGVYSVGAPKTQILALNRGGCLVKGGAVFGMKATVIKIDFKPQSDKLNKESPNFGSKINHL